MIDPRLQIPTLEDDFKAVVDSIRKVGIITGSVVLGGDTTLTTDNTSGFLKKDQVLLIDGKDCRINSATSTEIVVNKAVGGATSWKALFPYFMDGHIKEIAKRLTEKDKSGDDVIMYKKYPLIVLLQNLEYDMDPININEAPVSFVIVNSTNPEYITEDRREFNFTPILDPIYDEFIGALKDGTDKLILKNEKFKMKREYYWGSELADENPFNDRLDAIEVINLNLELITPNCV